MCQKEVYFPIPINKFAESMKQNKAREFMGIFVYGSSSSLKKQQKTMWQ